MGTKGFAYKPLAKKEIGELIRKVLEGQKSVIGKWRGAESGVSSRRGRTMGR